MRDGPSHHIKNLLLHAVPALNGTAVRTIPIRIVNEVFELLRVNCHDFFRRINRNSRFDRYGGVAVLLPLAGSRTL